MKRTVLFVLVVAAVGLPAWAHEKSLSVKPTEVQAGGKIEIEGAGLGRNAPIRLTLEGILNTYPLGEVQGNVHGEFRTGVVIPADVKPGTYSVKAEAGNTTASVSLKIVPAGAAMTKETQPAVAGGQEPPGHEHGVEGKPMKHTSIQPLKLKHARGFSEKITIWGLITVGLLLGSLLWFKG